MPKIELYHDNFQNYKPYGWISVKERMPTELTPVLIHTEATQEQVCMAFVENGKWTEGYLGRGIVLMQQGLVTHWMALPDPPKEENTLITEMAVAGRCASTSRMVSCGFGRRPAHD